jgi:hypothetical protein
MLQRLSSRKSSKTQVIPPNAAASMEFQMAIMARKFAPKAEPPLNPSHPNHKMNVPRLTIETLWGLKFRSSFLPLRPKTQASAKPPTPEPISTGPPPMMEKLLKFREFVKLHTRKIKNTPRKCPPVGRPGPIKNGKGPYSGLKANILTYQQATTKSDLISFRLAVYEREAPLHLDNILRII